MAKSFAVMKKDYFGEEKWCFCFGTDRTVTGIGKSNQRWWDTKEELIAELTALGIDDGKYDVYD